MKYICVLCLTSLSKHLQHDIMSYAYLSVIVIGHFIKSLGHYFYVKSFCLIFQDVAVVGTGRSHHKRKSKEILHNEPQCGVTKHRQFAKRIIGGKKAKFAELPWQVRCFINICCKCSLTCVKTWETELHNVIRTMHQTVVLKLLKKGNFYSEKL